MKCYIIRHAEKARGDFYNPRLRHQDQPISPKGQQDSLRLYPFLAEQQVAAIYISAYQRTRQTIEAAARRLNLIPAIDERLNEVDNGLFEGLTEAEVQQKFPQTLAAFRQRTADFRFPEGETGEEAQRRIVDFLEEKPRVHQTEQIILVSHDGLIRLLLCAILGIPVYKRWNFQVDPCGIMEIAEQPGFDDWKLIRFNAVLP